MPKEIMHWLVAEKTAAGLTGTCLGNAARRCPNALKIGAVFPDMPYYLAGTSKLAEMAALVANEYHGAHGEDTFILPRTVLSRIPDDNPPAHLSFLVGVVSHLQADIVFHPLIFFLTGNYHDHDPEKRSRAVCCHRRFEGMLDLHVCRLLKRKPGHFKAWESWRGLESRNLFGWAEGDKKRPELGTMLKLAAKRFLAAQRIFINPAASFLAEVLDPLLPHALKQLAALFYRPAPEYLMVRLSRTLEYRNPVSGEMSRTRVDELLDRAVEESVALCRRLESVWSGKNRSWLSERGPSLNFGLIGADVSLARYFAEPLFFEIHKDR
ncbi:MAG: zinc dependent phospholipase C family protein [Deltaproteobacteria bacterium]|nr:zinc dependent phospholipase C family protein [Deltaproteobacteria bacterium]